MRTCCWILALAIPALLAARWLPTGPSALVTGVAAAAGLFATALLGAGLIWSWHQDRGVTDT